MQLRKLILENAHVLRPTSDSPHILPVFLRGSDKKNMTDVPHPLKVLNSLA